MPDSPPPSGSIERWCWDFIHAHDAEAKLRPDPPPDARAMGTWEGAPRARRPTRPGRPVGWQLVQKSSRTPRPGALVKPEARARLVHTFLHHELQAAELFAWALLAFPDTPREFRAGLLRLATEELEHLALYREHLAVLGFQPGDFPVRDWFWERALDCADPVAFLAFQGLGLEGANLEHCARFAAQFRSAGDPAGAAILERVGREEEGHVAFAAHWFRAFTCDPCGTGATGTTGGLDYDRWRAALPAPLTPALLRGRPLQRAARLRAGLDGAFLDRLEREDAIQPRARASSEQDA